MKNNMALMVIVALLIAGGSFFAGTKYQENKQPQFQRQMNGGQRNGGRNGFRPVTGEILKADDTSITVKLPDGSSKIIMLVNSTQINKAEKGDKTELTTGTKVAVFGTENSDGSISASNIQINPQVLGASRQAPNQAQRSPDAKEIVVTASNYKYDPSTITVKKGEKTRIVLKNSGGMHDFVVGELNIRTAVISDGQEDFVEFTPDKTGTYEFYCSVDGHRDMGMKGTLVVE